MPFFTSIILSISICSRSPWYDELCSLAHYFSRPLSVIVSADYSPNNHILSSILVKAFTTLYSLISPTPAFQPITSQNPLFVPADGSMIPFRLPSILAGAFASLALSFPLLKAKQLSIKTSITFLLVAVLTAFHPWLQSFSTEARGYTLLLFFALLGTNLLPTFATRFSISYLLAVTAAIYTIPIAVLLLPAHALTLLLLHRTVPRRWFLAAGIILSASALLYAPFLREMRTYSSTLPAVTVSFTSYLASLACTLLTGWDSPGSLSLLFLPLLPLGFFLFFKTPALTALRPTLLTFSFAALFILLLACFNRNFAIVRFNLWLIPVSLLCLAPLLLSLQWLHFLAPAAAAILPLAFFSFQDYTLSQIPPQPIAESFIRADAIAPPGVPLICIYMASVEADAIYGPAFDRPIAVAYDLPTLKQFIAASPTPPWLLLFYEAPLQAADPEFLAYINSQYIRQSTLPGRVSPTIIFKPK